MKVKDLGLTVDDALHEILKRLQWQGEEPSRYLVVGMQMAMARVDALATLLMDRRLATEQEYRELYRLALNDAVGRYRTDKPFHWERSRNPTLAAVASFVRQKPRRKRSKS